MLDCRPSMLPIDAGKNVIENSGLPSVDATFYHKLEGQLFFTTNPDLTFVLPLGNYRDL